MKKRGQIKNLLGKRRGIRMLLLLSMMTVCSFFALFAAGCDLLHKHDWDEWEIIKPATCSAMGEKIRVCKSDPSHIETVTIEIDPTAHDYGAWKVTKESTCSTTGEKTRICKIDSAHKEIVSMEIDPAAHDYDVWKVTKEPTCSAAGEKTRVCKRDNSHKETAAIEIDPDAHDFITKEVKCGCELGSYNIELCKTCGKSFYDQTVKPKAHVGVNVCTDCGMNFIDAYKNYITSEGKYYESDSESAYRIVDHEICDDGTYYQYQWWYQTDGTIKWMLFQIEDIYSDVFNFEFDISWKAKDSLFDWELFVYDTLTIMNGSLRPKTISDTTQYLTYSSVKGFYLSEEIKASLSKLACTSLQLLLASTNLRLVPPEGYSVVNYGFTNFTKPLMLHEYTVSSGTMDSNTHKGQLNFSCSHCSEKRTVEFDLNTNANALCAPATSDALHASPLEGETLFQERKFCLAGDFKRVYKRRLR